MVDFLRHALTALLLLGAGCASSAPPAEASRKPGAEADLHRVQSRLAEAGTIRLHVEGRWAEFGAFALRKPLRGNPQSFSADLLLGEQEKARLTLVVTDRAGIATTYAAISDGKRVRLNDPAALLEFPRTPAALRRELASAISSGGIGSWFVKLGRSRDTLLRGDDPRGDDFPMADGRPAGDPRPGDPLFDPPRAENGTGEARVLNHYCPSARRRVRVWFDAATGDLRKREALDPKAVWCTEAYSDLRIGTKIPDAEFRLPE